MHIPLLPSLTSVLFYRYLCAGEHVSAAEDRLIFIADDTILKILHNFALLFPIPPKKNRYQSLLLTAIEHSRLSLSLSKHRITSMKTSLRVLPLTAHSQLKLPCAAAQEYPKAWPGRC